MLVAECPMVVAAPVHVRCSVRLAASRCRPDRLAVDGRYAPTRNRVVHRVRGAFKSFFLAPCYATGAKAGKAGQGRGMAKVGPAPWKVRY